MAIKVSPYQQVDAKYWSGKMSEKTLGALWQTQPAKAYKTLTHMLAANTVPDRMRELEKYPTLSIDPGVTEFTWDIIGSTRRNIPLQEARVAGSAVTSSSTGVGLGGATIELVFAEDWFGDGEIIIGEKNEAYPIRVLGEPLIEGTGVVYTCQVWGSAVDDGIPGEELVAGKRFSSEYYAPIERERSRKVGTIRHGIPISMKNEIMIVRKDHEVSGLELDKKFVTAIPYRDPITKQVKAFGQLMTYKDWIFEQEFSMGIGNALIFGKTNRNEYGEYKDRGKSGNLIKFGLGLREQMQVAQTKIYDVFNLQWITDALTQLSAGRLDMKNRKFKLITGEKGAEQFHKAALDVVSGWSSSNDFLRGSNHPALIKNVQASMHDNAISFGYQIVEYRAPNGVTVTVEIDPTYDDEERNKIYKDGNPAKGVAESYRYDIMFNGMVDDEYSNITVVKVKGRENGTRGYSGGPFGKWFGGVGGNDYASTDVDEYSCSKKQEIGIILRDPTRTITLLPQDLAHLA